MAAILSRIRAANVARFIDWSCRELRLWLVRRAYIRSVIKLLFSAEPTTSTYNIGKWTLKLAVRLRIVSHVWSTCPQ